MGKRKIGILVLTDKVKDRMTRKNNYFDSLEYAGFKRIINDIDKVKYEVEFCSFYNINNYEFVLWSVISYFDIFNFLNEAKKYIVKTKIVIGGAAVCNIYPLYDYIHAACFGRGETLINKILDGEYLSNVWYKKYDENLTKKYNIGQLIELINIDNYHEKSIGCPNKCRFCQYSWKYNCTSKNNYTSGMDETEELFIDLNWEKAKRRAITAIDGTTEFDRKMVHKNLTGKQIYNKLIEVYNLNYEKPLYLKLFNIVGYPWENENHNFNELRDIFKEADKTKKTHSVWVKIFNNHFKPMPLTPTESEPVNKINYRDKYFNSNKIYMGNNFEVTISPYGTTPHTACEETIVNRMFDSDNLMRIYTNKKYLNLKGKDKLKVFEKYNPEVFEEINNLPTNYLLTPYNLTKQKEVYKKNLLKYK